MTIAETIFAGHIASVLLEDNLYNIGVPFDDNSFDDYDYSIELFDVSDEYQLSIEAQKIIFDAGFSIAYLNHKNKWETHYQFTQGEFKEVEGWRVSYPQKRGKDEKGIWIEKKIESWPKEWFETGYAVVKEKE